MDYSIHYIGTDGKGKIVIPKQKITKSSYISKLMENSTNSNQCTVKISFKSMLIKTCLCYMASEEKYFDFNFNFDLFPIAFLLFPDDDTFIKLLLVKLHHVLMENRDRKKTIKLLTKFDIYIRFIPKEYLNYVINCHVIKHKFFKRYINFEKNDVVKMNQYVYYQHYNFKTDMKCLQDDKNESIVIVHILPCVNYEEFEDMLGIRYIISSQCPNNISNEMFLFSLDIEMYSYKINFYDITKIYLCQLFNLILFDGIHEPLKFNTFENIKSIDTLKDNCVYTLIDEQTIVLKSGEKYTLPKKITFIVKNVYKYLFSQLILIEDLTKNVDYVNHVGAYIYNLNSKIIFKQIMYDGSRRTYKKN